jgi:hypothetical protein
MSKRKECELKANEEPQAKKQKISVFFSRPTLAEILNALSECKTTCLLSDLNKIIADYAQPYETIRVNHDHALVITGSRYFTDYDKFKEVIASETKGACIVAGDCKGADALAKKFAKDSGLCFHEFKADWKKFGLAAGPIRNLAMLKWANANCKTIKLIAFLAKNSKGTANCIGCAEKLGIATVIHSV